MKFCAGLDLGQAADYTALSVIEKVQTFKLDEEGELLLDRDRLPVLERTDYQCRHLQRFALGTSYPKIVAQVKKILETAPLKGQCTLVVDYTGVGRPVVDIIREAKLRPIAVSITAGLKEGHDDNGYTVPKRDLVFGLVSLLQDQKLTFAKSLPDAAVLVKELMSYQIKVTEKANESYNAREGAHDDLVLSVALAAWWVAKSGTSVLFAA